MPNQERRTGRAGDRSHNPLKTVDCTSLPINHGPSRPGSKSLNLLLVIMRLSAAMKEHAMQQQLDVFITSLTTFWTQLAGFVPQLLAALLLLFVGWLLANLVRTGVMKLLDVLKFDMLAEKTGIEAFLKQGNLDISLSKLMAKLAYWVIIFIVVVTVANSLGLHMVAELFNKVVLYIPNIIVAILVLV
ncbi:MAG: hypothetical protein V2I51_24055, partial [Anderseniella sp.]|nr:hypothetical protein [Anderseniella sp.]